jgi:hypothetical protein
MIVLPGLSERKTSAPSGGTRDRPWLEAKRGPAFNHFGMVITSEEASFKVRVERLSVHHPISPISPFLCKPAPHRRQTQMIISAAQLRRH